MNFNILKNDLNRKKSINVILFLFVILATMLMAGSMNVLYSTSTAINRMMKMANVPTFSIYAYDNPTTNKQIEDWAGSSKKVASYQKDEILIIMTDAFYSGSKQIVPKATVTSALLTAIPKDHSLVFDQDDKEMELNSGEIAIPMAFHKTYNINIGDTISIHVGESRKEFRVAAYEKDIVFGSDMISKRFVVNDEDFNAYKASDSLELIKLNFWAIDGADGSSYRQIAGEFGNKAISALFYLGADDINTSYIVAKIIAVVMIIVSLCLILISFLILRFTIVFTIQEDYREIGVMKAIGIRNKIIRRLYLTKYFAISVVGGVIGLFLSFVYASFMQQNISDLFIGQKNSISVLIASISTIMVVVLSILFCLLCTRKINKVSVVDAIRMGNTGERFSKSRRIHLSKQRWMNAADFLSCSDLLNGFKKFVILTITFVISTMLIIVPLNIINTLKDSDAMLSLFGMPAFDATVMTDKIYSSAVNGDSEGLEAELSHVEGVFAQNGYPLDIHVELAKTANLYTDNSNDSLNVMAWRSCNYPSGKYNFTKGTLPEENNEIAVSTKVAEYYGISIGDSIICNLQGEAKTFIITGLYQSMMNHGASVRLSGNYPMSLNGFASISVYGKFADATTDAAKMKERMQKSSPDITIGSSNDLYNSNMGGTVNAIDSMNNLILAVVVGITFLITSLIVRMLISREISEIATLKSIGFRKSDLRRWQIGRIVIILILSTVIGTILAATIGSSLVAGVFSMMGATSVPLIIVPVQVYLIYPGFLLISTIIAAATSIGQLNKTQIWEINNQE